jgi:hypothetical protein
MQVFVGYTKCALCGLMLLVLPEEVTETCWCTPCYKKHLEERKCQTPLKK